MKKISDQSGALHLLVLGVIAVAIVAGAGVWVYLRQNKEPKPALLKENVSQQDNEQVYKPLDEAAVQELKNSAAQTPAATTPSTVKTAPKSTATPGNNSASAPAPATNAGQFSFSADGCTVTGTGEPGWSVEIGAYTGTKGGSASYTLPASGTITKSSGGFKGMYAYGKFSNAQNPNIYMEAVPISADQCPAAG